jgi:2-C-methyl-D-erythritol 4-phosphate cytidylyltransferase
MQKTAIIVAGGTGSRMQSEVPKQLLPLGGLPILWRTVRAFLCLDAQLQLVLVLHPEVIGPWQAIVAEQGMPLPDHNRIHTCPGGTTRTASVHAGLRALQQRVADPTACLVAVHDGVRPFASRQMLGQAYELAAEKGAAVACVPVKFSLRQQRPDGLSVPVDRSEFLEVQTPQVFGLAALLRAYDQAPHDRFTDDASLYETVTGKPVAISPGSYDNLKLTTPEDLFVAEQILARWEE